MALVADYYSINHKNKSFGFIRKCTGRWSDIKGCHLLTDGEILKRDGLIPNARPISNGFVAKKVAKSARVKVERCKIRRFRNEVL